MNNETTTKQLNNSAANNLPDDIVVSVKNVSKKFCKHLRRSMAYGIADLSKNLLGIKPNSTELRKNEFWAVDDISFDLRRGEGLGLIGPNGSGKTTLLRLLTGIFPPDTGEIMVKGRVGALIALGAGFHPHMTGRENIYLNGTILGMTREEIDFKFKDIVDFADIGDFLDAPVSSYSSGMRVRLGFSIAVQIKPQILIVDEVLAVGDVGFRMKCFDQILCMMDEGTSIIVVSHNLTELSRVTKRTIVLNNGKIFYDGSIEIGIGYYHNLMTLPQKHEKQQYIGGKPRIESVRLLNDSGQEIQNFFTGKTLTAEISIRSKKVFRRARLVVVVFSPACGAIGCFSTPYNNFNFDITPPATTIRFSMTNLPLLIGGYYFEISLYGPEITDFYDIKVPVANFQVVGPEINTLGYGICHIFKFEHKWEQVIK